MPASNHPVWYIAKLAIVATVLCFSLTVNYENGFDLRKDAWTVFSVLLGLGGVDAAARTIKKVQEQSE